jgi:hypothetical protein
MLCCRMHFLPASIAVVASFLTAVPVWADETENRITEIRAGYAEIEALGAKGEEIRFESESDPLSGTLTRFGRMARW